MSQNPDSVTLIGAKDKEGRLYLVDNRAHLPHAEGEFVELTEFRVAPDRVEWSVLSVQLEEMRGITVTIHIGDYIYVTPSSPKR